MHEGTEQMRWIALAMALAMASSGCTHTPTGPEVYVISEDARGVGTLPGTGGAGGRDCQAEHEACFRKCWEKSRPKWPHKHDEWYYKRCTTDCLEAFNTCMDDQEEEAREQVKKLEFSNVDQAIKWIREHKTEVAIGTIVIIAGVAFVITTGGSGMLLLAPLAI